MEADEINRMDWFKVKMNVFRVRTPKIDWTNMLTNKQHRLLSVVWHCQIRNTFSIQMVGYFSGFVCCPSIRLEHSIDRSFLELFISFMLFADRFNEDFRRPITSRAAALAFETHIFHFESNRWIIHSFNDESSDSSQRLHINTYVMASMPLCGGGVVVAWKAWAQQRNKSKPERETEKNSMEKKQQKCSAQKMRRYTRSHSHTHTRNQFWPRMHIEWIISPFICNNSITTESEAKNKQILCRSSNTIKEAIKSSVRPTRISLGRIISIRCSFAINRFDGSTSTSTRPTAIRFHRSPLVFGWPLGDAVVRSACTRKFQLISCSCR